MGADFITSSLIWDEDKKLNWDAGKKIIEEIFKEAEEKDEVVETESGCEIDKDTAISSLESVEHAVKHGTRENDLINVDGHVIFITGGMSWGESPTTLYDDIYNICIDGVLEAIGFTTTEYSLMMKKILKKKSLLPLLMGIDKELDKIISKKLK